jgi:hypothetical protein
MQVVVQFEWHEVGEVTLDTQGQLKFPQLPPEPGVYRFRLVGALIEARLHIGAGHASY